MDAAKASFLRNATVPIRLHMSDCPSNRGHCCRPAVVEALARIAPQFGDHLMLLPGLDALADDGQPECMCELDRHGHDGATRLVPNEVGDEALIDLDDVDRKSLQIAERRVASSEVIEGQEQAEPFEPVEHDVRSLSVPKQGP